MSTDPNPDKIRVLEEALAFYAKPENWERQVTPQSAPYCLTEAVLNDNGRRARMALGLPEPEEIDIPF